MLITLATGNSAKDTKPVQKTVNNWQEYILLIRSLAKPNAKKPKIPYIWGAMLDPNGRRSLKNAGNRHVLYLDMDGCTNSAWALLSSFLDRYQCFAYTTASHQPDSPRWRVGILLSREVTASEYQQLGPLVEKQIMDDFMLLSGDEIKWDRSVYNPAQMVFAPQQEAEFTLYDGTPLDVDQFDLTITEAPTPTQRDITIDEFTESDLRSALWHPEVLKLGAPGNYQEWINIGNRLASFIGTEFEDNAKALWLEWSMDAGGSAEDVQVAEGRWDNGLLKADRTGYQAIFAIAQTKGWINPAVARAQANSVASVDDFSDISIKDVKGFTDINTNVLKHFEERFVHVKNQDKIYDLMTLSFFPSVQGFKNFMAPYRIMDGKKEIPATKLWLENPKKLIAEDVIYVPINERLIDRENGLFINTYRAPKHPDLTMKGLISNDKLHVFLGHMQYLVPNQTECEYFIARLAKIVQEPHKRCPIAILHISSEHGVGRGWISQLMAKVLGKWNAKRATMKEIFDSPYHDYLDKSLLCTIDEAHEPDKRYTISDRIRSILSEPELNVNIKFGRKGMMEIYTSFLFFTNHHDALALPNEDRRIAVIGGPDFFNSNEHYEQVYKALDNPFFIAQVYHYLKNLDLSKYDFQRAPHSASRKLMIEHTKSDIENALDDLLAQNKYEAMSYLQIVNEMEREFGLEIDVKNKTQYITRLLKKKTKSSSRKVKIKGRTKQIWVLSKNTTLSNDQLRNIYLQVEQEQNTLDLEM